LVRIKSSTTRDAGRPCSSAISRKRSRALSDRVKIERSRLRGCGLGRSRTAPQPRGWSAQGIGRPQMRPGTGSSASWARQVRPLTSTSRWAADRFPESQSGRLVRFLTDKVSQGEPRSPLRCGFWPALRAANDRTSRTDQSYRSNRWVLSRQRTAAASLRLARVACSRDTGSSRSPRTSHPTPRSSRRSSSHPPSGGRSVRPVSVGAPCLDKRQYAHSPAGAQGDPGNYSPTGPLPRWG